jgi:hypothetical protein
MEREIHNNEYGLDRLEVIKTDQARYASQRSSEDPDLQKRVIAQSVYSKQIREI